jgi:hypothetical protein
MYFSLPIGAEILALSDGFPVRSSNGFSRLLPCRPQALLGIPIHTNHTKHYDVKCNTFLKSSVICACRYRTHYTRDSPAFRSWDSVVGIATGYGLNDRGVGVRVKVKNFLFFISSRPTLRPAHPSTGYKGPFTMGSSARGMILTTHLQLMLRSGKCGSVHLLPHTSSRRRA